MSEPPWARNGCSEAIWKPPTGATSKPLGSCVLQMNALQLLRCHNKLQLTTCATSKPLCAANGCSEATSQPQPDRTDNVAIAISHTEAIPSPCRPPALPPARPPLAQPLAHRTARFGHRHEQDIFLFSFVDQQAAMVTFIVGGFWLAHGCCM